MSEPGTTEAAPAAAGPRRRRIFAIANQKGGVGKTFQVSRPV